MQNYTINLRVVTKTQTTNANGSTKFVTILEADGEANGFICLTTENAETDTFFVTDGSFTANVVTTPE